MSGFPVHKRHAGILSSVEAGQVLVVVDNPPFRFHFCRLERPAGGAVHRQSASEFESIASVFDGPVRPSGPSCFGPWGHYEQQSGLPRREAETAPVVEDRGAFPVFALPVEFRDAYRHVLGFLGIPAQGYDGILRPAAVGHDHGERGLGGYPVLFNRRIGCDPVEHEPCVVGAGLVELPVAYADLEAGQPYGENRREIRYQAYHLDCYFPLSRLKNPRLKNPRQEYPGLSVILLFLITVVRRLGSVGEFSPFRGVSFLRRLPSSFSHFRSFPMTGGFYESHK